LSLRSDDLDSVGERYTEDELGQLIVAVEAPPAPLGGLGKFEDHGERVSSFSVFFSEACFELAATYGELSGTYNDSR
jgi:hypothetical protein